MPGHLPRFGPPLHRAAGYLPVEHHNGEPARAYPAGGRLALSALGTLFIAQSSGKLTAVSMR